MKGWLCTWGNRHQYGESCKCEEKANLAFLEWKERERLLKHGRSDKVSCPRCRRVFGGDGITPRERDMDLMAHTCVGEGGR